jgi:hypothetical protein
VGDTFDELRSCALVRSVTAFLLVVGTFTGLPTLARAAENDSPGREWAPSTWGAGPVAQSDPVEPITAREGVSVDVGTDDAVSVDVASLGHLPEYDDVVLVGEVADARMIPDAPITPEEPLEADLPASADPTVTPDPPAKTPWYEKLNIRGYAQFRYNRFPSFDRNDDLINLQGDRYIGAGSGAGIRRARVILFGDVHEQVYVYFQPDFASSIGEQNHVAIVRDWYTDIAFDKEKTFRVRVGQSKVPFGFENLQSSQNRLALDRNDALNSAVKDERDMGAFFYWAPKHIRERFSHLVSSNLKGSGDYGVFGFGVYNGQTANQFDRNDDLHLVARVTWPFLIGDQFVEIGGGGYRGLYRVSLAEQADGTTYTTPSPTNDLRDERAFGTVVVYPQPIGLQAEFNVGRGPQQGVEDPTVIESRPLHGGYVQAMAKIDDVLGTVALFPFVRGTIYQGGKKFMTNAPRYDVKELELGIEWQVFPALEVVLAYDIVDRTSDRYPYNQEQGQITRLQVQANF